MAEKRVWIEGGNVEAVAGPMQYIGQGSERIWIEGGNIAITGGGGGGGSTVKGAWSNVTAYSTGDIVTFGNSAYVALQASTGSTPPRNNGGTQQCLMDFTPTIPDNSDSASIEIGCLFQVDQTCQVTAVNWYRGNTNNAGPWSVRVWNWDTSTILNTTAQGAVTASGWQSQTLSSPITVNPGTNYAVSYTDPGGHYSNTPEFFRGGQYRYGVAKITGSAFNSSIGSVPNTFFNNTLYFVSPTLSVASNADWLQIAKGY